MAQPTGAVKSKGKFSRYFRGVKAELKKVIWPSKKDLVNYTTVVIVISVLISLIVYVLDTVIRFGLSKILG
ncbi:MAG: preprotein translocase subunit SecE [Tissierellia bacterium]|nr:preprotein translocase subunit SecE [Tissierellia bacterium]